MTSAVVHARVGTEPIDVAALERAVQDRRSGAVTSFVGIVREIDGGRGVARLDYEAHPDAERVLHEVADEVAAEHGVIKVAVEHRVGQLDIGEAALVAAVSATHRVVAFAAIEVLVDGVKARIPVWKHQIYADGTSDWVNSA